MEKRHLIIFERSMNNRFIEFALENKLSYSLMDMDNSFDRGVFFGIINRIITRRAFLNNVKELISFITSNQIDTLFLSNTEGYIGHTACEIFKRSLPNTKLVILQHGVFPLEKNKLRNIIAKIINQVTYLCFGIYVLGEGFGSVIVNKYIVYGNAEKQFLIKEKGWDSDKIEVNLKFLKSYLLRNQEKHFVKSESQNNAILLLQSLAGSKLCSIEDEKILINETIKYLSNKYTKVYVKEHPYCADRIYSFQFPNNVEVIDDMIQGFYKVSNAYSFFSTALIDAKFFNLDTSAIFSNKLKVKKSIYNIFDNVIDFESEISA